MAGVGRCRPPSAGAARAELRGVGARGAVQFTARDGRTSQVQTVAAFQSAYANSPLLTGLPYRPFQSPPHE